MKSTSFLVNTARASLVDPAALYGALREHRIAGAALDVHDHEPLDPGDPYVSLDNVTLTPHLASSTRDCLEKSPRLLAADVHRLVIGRRPRFVVNPEVFDRAEPTE
jgi:D-3-phosphoglycerate dehydrogenase